MSKSACFLVVVAVASFLLCPGAEAANPRLIHAVILGESVFGPVPPPPLREVNGKSADLADPFAAPAPPPPAPREASGKSADLADPFAAPDPPRPAKAPSAGADLPAEMAKAVEAFGKGDFDDALRAMDTLVEDQPELRPAQLLMEKLVASAQEQAERRKSFERDIRMEWRAPEAYAGLGELALNERRLVEAELLYAKAEDLADVSPGEPEQKRALMQQILSGLASVAELRRDYEEAQRRLRALLEIDPQNPDALRRFGRARYLQELEEEREEGVPLAPPEVRAPEPPFRPREAAPEVRAPEIP